MYQSSQQNFNAPYSVTSPTQTRKSSVKQKKSFTLENKLKLAGATRRFANPRIESQEWDKKTQEEFQIQENIKADLAPKQEIFYKLLKGEKVDSTQQFVTIRAYSPTGSPRQLKINKFNLKRYARFVCQKNAAGNSLNSLNMQTPPTRLFDSLKIEKCQILNSCNDLETQENSEQLKLDDLQTNSKQFSHSMRASPLKSKETILRSADDDEIKKITQTTTQSFETLPTTPQSVFQQGISQQLNTECLKNTIWSQKIDQATKRAQLDLINCTTPSQVARISQIFGKTASQGTQFRLNIKKIQLQLQEKNQRFKQTEAFSKSRQEINYPHSQIAKTQREKHNNIKQSRKFEQRNYKQEQERGVKQMQHFQTSAGNEVCTKMYLNSEYDTHIAQSLAKICNSALRGEFQSCLAMPIQRNSSLQINNEPKSALRLNFEKIRVRELNL